jgi:membrane protein YdbS with pleckstrin-like domain
MTLSYKYSLSATRLSIELGILNVQRKHIAYRKLQDIILQVSFAQSFARLASVKLDTGSKETLQRRSNQRSYALTSASSAVESIPDLMLQDASALRKNIAERMGVSLKGIGADSLKKKFPLKAVKPLKKTLWLAVFLLPVLAVLLLANPFGAAVGAVAAALVSVILLVKYAYERMYYESYFYDVNDEVLVIKKGVFGFREIIVPFAKIQDVFVDQDILDRLFGLRDVYVSTVTQRSMMNAHIDGVGPEDAMKIAGILINRTKGV